MRAFPAVICALALSTSSVLAAGSAAPLSEGKPAGTHKAQLVTTTNLALIGGIGILAAGIAVAASAGNDTPGVSSTIATTTTTSP